MTINSHTNALILVVEDIDETRYGIEKLLKADGYRISLARDETEAIENAQQKSPDLILVSLGGSANEVIMAAERIREAADVRARVPVVILSIDGIDDGEEVTIDQNVHLICPDNFNQLRGLMVRLLGDLSVAQTDYTLAT